MRRPVVTTSPSHTRTSRDINGLIGSGTVSALIRTQMANTVLSALLKGPYPMHWPERALDSFAGETQAKMSQLGLMRFYVLTY